MSDILIKLIFFNIKGAEISSVTFYIAYKGLHHAGSEKGRPGGGSFGGLLR
jgi:hypothetical protein